MTSADRSCGTALVRGGGVPARLTVLSGPSGVGKSTVVAGLRKESPEIWLSVSVTTRAPRPGEVDGREYHFVSDAEFDQMLARGDLLEWATFAGHRYGTPRGPLAEKLAAGVPALLEIDLAGARQEAARVELAAEDEFDLTLINTSVGDVCRQLVALTVGLVAP